MSKLADMALLVVMAAASARSLSPNPAESCLENGEKRRRGNQVGVGGFPAPARPAPYVESLAVSKALPKTPAPDHFTIPKSPAGGSGISGVLRSSARDGGKGDARFLGNGQPPLFSRAGYFGGRAAHRIWSRNAAKSGAGVEQQGI